MPPPNHHTGAFSGRSSWWRAMKNRTFMCTVGTCGLRGCSTRDTPMASKPRPASSGRWADAEGGSCLPVTCEKPTPPRSSNAEPSMMRVSPPPPSVASAGFSHASYLKGWPASVSNRSTMRSCKPSRYSRTAWESTNSLTRAAPVSPNVPANEFEHVRVPRDDIVRLEDPMILVREDEQLAWHAVVLQRFEQHQPFAHRAAIVQLTMDDQGRRLPARDVLPG